jgi:hypothetical protein
MKQLFYTSCRAGKSLSGASGFQVRAASEGLTPEQIRYAVGYAGYLLPSSVTPDEQTVKSAPVRLALLQTPELGRIICHGVYAGKDPESKRYGNFFSHLLLEVPKSVDADWAIQTWGSSFWRRHDDDSDGPLDDVAELRGAATLSDAKLTGLLKDKAGQSLVQFVLNGLLVTPEDHRLFVLAPAQEVALCVYAVSRLLPHAFQSDFTFSTYESEPLMCRARLVGTWLGEAPDEDLPSACYVEPCWAFNRSTGRQSLLPVTSNYADFAVKAFVSDENRAKLDQVRGLCEKLEVQSPDLLDLTFRAIQRDGCESFTRAEGERVLQHRPLAEWLVTSKRTVAPFLAKAVGWSLEEQVFYDQSLPRLLAALRGQIKPLTGALVPDCSVLHRVSAWLELEEFLSQPELDAQTLQRLAEVVNDQPAFARARRRHEMVAAVGDRLLKQAERSDVRSEMEVTLRCLGHAHADGAVGIYRQLLAHYDTSSGRAWRHLHLVHALFAVALGEVSQPDYHAFGEALTEEVKGLRARVAKQRGGRKSLKAINRLVREWGSLSARQRWHQIYRSKSKSLLKWVLLPVFALLAFEEILWDKLGTASFLSGKFGWEIPLLKAKEGQQPAEPKPSMKPPAKSEPGPGTKPLPANPEPAENQPKG